MALETTAEAGTCLACRSMLGLVGSSGRMEGVVDEGGRKLSLPIPHPQPCLQAQTTIPKAPQVSRTLLTICPQPRVPTSQTVVLEAQPLPRPSHQGHPSKGLSRPS